MILLPTMFHIYFDTFRGPCITLLLRKTSSYQHPKRGRNTYQHLGSHSWKDDRSVSVPISLKTPTTLTSVRPLGGGSVGNFILYVDQKSQSKIPSRYTVL